MEWPVTLKFKPYMERQMTSTTNDFVTDRVRCWYYTEQNSMALLIVAAQTLL